MAGRPDRGSWFDLRIDTSGAITDRRSWSVFGSMQWRDQPG
jgi:hypothetical protein